MNTTNSGIKTAILVADDDPVCRLFCVQALTVGGYRAVAASTGHEAIQMALKTQPQVIVIDIHLPDTSGVTAVSRLLESWPQTKAVPRFIGVTGDDSPQLRTALLTAGFAAVLTKPFVIAALLACVRKTCNQRIEAEATAVHSDTGRDSLAADTFPPETAHSLQRIFCSGLNRQLSRLDRAITSLDWQHGSDILHRLSGAAAVAGYPVLASCGRRLLRQLNRPRDVAGLAESYLDLLREAAEPGMDPEHDAGPGFRRCE